VHLIDPAASRHTLHRRARRGYAMVSALITVFVLTTLVLVVASATVSDQKVSHTDQATARARQAAAGALEDLYSRMQRNPYLLDDVLQISRPDGTRTTPLTAADMQRRYSLPLFDTTRPLAGQTWGRWSDVGPSTRWAGTGQVIAGTGCTPGDPQQVCYLFKIAAEAGGPDTVRGSLAGPATAVVQVTARTNCRNVIGTGANVTGSGCTYARLQQRMHRNQPLDYLFYTQYSALDPALYTSMLDAPLTPAQAQAQCADRYARRTSTVAGTAMLPRSADCIEVAYQGVAGRQDVIRGPVFTNDDFVAVCGRPQFTANVYTAGTGAWYQTADAPCQAAPASGPSLFTNGAAGYSAQPELTLPPLYRATEAASLAPRDYRLRPATTGGTVTINLVPSVTVGGITGPGVTVTGAVKSDGTPAAATMLLPASKALHVSGNAAVSGTLDGQLAVFVTGTLTITDDLRYTGGTTGDDMLALQAGGAIVIRPSTAGDLTIHATLVSLGNAVSVQNWDVPTNVATSPRLTFFGAMAAKYQGVFGSYDPFDGSLASGYLKDFSFDDFSERLRGYRVTPPPLMSLTALAWNRLDTSEVPSCGDGGDDAFCAGIR
jgi:hypothetical protein